MQNGTIQRIDWLDIARFLAAVSVMLFHYTYFGIFKGPVSNISDFDLLSEVSRYGYLGVDVFFIISGYVIAISATNKSAEQFAVSRLLRLYPMFWACMLFSATLIYLFGGSLASISLIDVFKNFTMFPEPLGAAFVDGVYWTLKLEMQFYVYVFCILLLGQWKNFKLIVGGMVVGMAGAQLLNPEALQTTNYYYLFGVGVFISFIGKQGFRPINVGVLSVATSMAILNAVVKAGADIQLPLGASLNTIFVGTFFLAVIGFFVVAVRSGFHKIHIPYARMMGALTYPVYLTHTILGYFTLQYLSPYIGKWPSLFVAILTTFIVSLSFHYLIEIGARPYFKVFFVYICRRPHKLWSIIKAVFIKPQTYP